MVVEIKRISCLENVRILFDDHTVYELEEHVSKTSNAYSHTEYTKSQNTNKPCVALHMRR